MPQGLPAVRPTAYQARPGSRPAQRRLAVPEHPQARAQENAQCSAAMSASPVRRRSNRRRTANSWWQQNQDRRAERAGRRLYERIEAAAATIEAGWAEQVGAPRLEELRTALSDLMTHRQGRPVRQRP